MKILGHCVYIQISLILFGFAIEKVSRLVLLISFEGMNGYDLSKIINADCAGHVKK